MQLASCGTLLTPWQVIRKLLLLGQVGSARQAGNGSSAGDYIGSKCPGTIAKSPRDKYFWRTGSFLTNQSLHFDAVKDNR
jgi:hypothetical protein